MIACPAQGLKISDASRWWTIPFPPAICAQSHPPFLTYPRGQVVSALGRHVHAVERGALSGRSLRLS